MCARARVCVCVCVCLRGGGGTSLGARIWNFHPHPLKTSSQFYDVLCADTANLLKEASYLDIDELHSMFP